MYLSPFWGPRVCLVCLVIFEALEKEYTSRLFIKHVQLSSLFLSVNLDVCVCVCEQAKFSLSRKSPSNCRSEKVKGWASVEGCKSVRKLDPWGINHPVDI